jgi:hypothetical protein
MEGLGREGSYILEGLESESWLIKDAGRDLLGYDFI